MTTYLEQRKRHLMFLIVMLIAVFITVTGFSWNVKDVTVVADGQTYTTQTHLNSAEGIVNALGIKKDPKDALVLSTPNVENGTIISIIRAFPVQVIVNGKTRTVKTVQTTPKGLADELGYKVPKYVPLGNENEILTENSIVTIGHVTSRSVKTEERPIDVQIVYEEDATLPKGEELQSQVGTPGLETVEEEILYEKGKEIKRNIISRSTITAMTPTIIKVGTAEKIVPSLDNVKYSEVLTMEASAYLPTDGGGGGITATGVRAEHGIVAVDPNVIPLGTRLYIPGYGVAVAADTGGAIIGHRIDLVMESYTDAINFGRRNIEVYILE